jgi:gliding motility-associated-like protein
LKNTLLIILLLAFACPLFARHIIGGEITYKYIGNDQYQFFMKIYRDCTTNDGAKLDNPASITLFRGTNVVTNIEARLDSSRQLSKPNLPCTETDANVCVQEGSYSWTLPLPAINESYTVVYQRCCRNNTITNIWNPESSGASYSIELSPAAQLAHNNSPTFRSFPPILICGGFPLTFDHSAVDADGDQLTYEFCAPLLGGGQVGSDGQSNPQVCAGVTPVPACLSMMTPVQFRVPAYTAAAPLAGNPAVRIDPNTGLITGTPAPLLGQFVVGVCVKEYRNGLLLSTLRRDFQFNVLDCNPTVLAKIKADTALAGKEFFIQSCGSNTVSIENQSVKQSFIGNDFYWSFNVHGKEQRSTNWNLNITFPDTGTYRGKLFLKPGAPCADTASMTIKVYSKPIANFSYAYDTCVAGTVAFQDHSSSPAGRISSWNWQYGDGTRSPLQNPEHLYQTPGVKNIVLQVEDSKGCKADTTRPIRWYPVPPILIIEPSRYIDCTPTHTEFKNLSVPIDSTYKINWNFGDGTTGTGVSPKHTYTQAGTYSVSLNVTSPIGCKTSASYPNWIKVKQGAVANFDFTPEKPNTFLNTVQFRDLSQFTTRWQWFFSNKGYSTQQNPTFVFRDSGVHKIKLLASNLNNCVDSMIKYIDVEPKVIFHLPNAFSANQDGKNDFFKGTGFLEGMIDFKMRIWNRWGEMVFETNNPNEGWNGQKFNSGREEPEGVYICVVQFTGPRGEPHEIEGFATLIR